MLVVDRRHFGVVLIGACTGCGTGNTGLELPATVAEWRLAGTPLADDAAGKWSGRYEGVPEIRLELERMSSQTLAFSAVQSWRAEAGKLAFFRGRYFGVVTAPGADTRTLSRFVAAFEKTLPQ
jgi:hypothetical protein